MLQAKGRETPNMDAAASVLAAKAGTFRHAALGPRGAPPVPDPRVLEWAVPRDMQARRARVPCLLHR